MCFLLKNAKLKIISLLTVTGAILCVSPSKAETFVMPVDGKLYLEVVNAKPGAEWKFGVGTSAANCQVFLASLPDTSFPKGEIPVENAHAGSPVPFCMWSKYGASSAWAFSGGSDAASQVAFWDGHNTLHMGGNIIEQTGPTTWVMHLDNAVSYLYDDSNDDILIAIRIEPIGLNPSPSPVPLNPGYGANPELKDIKTIYVGSFGNDKGADLIRAKVISRIVKSGRLQVVESEEQADAILTGVGQTSKSFVGLSPGLRRTVKTLLTVR